MIELRIIAHIRAVFELSTLNDPYYLIIIRTTVFAGTGIFYCTTGCLVTSGPVSADKVAADRDIDPYVVAVLAF